MKCCFNETDVTLPAYPRYWQAVPGAANTSRVMVLDCVTTFGPMPVIV